MNACAAPIKQDLALRGDEIAFRHTKKHSQQETKDIRDNLWNYRSQSVEGMKLYSHANE